MSASAVPPEKATVLPHCEGPRSLLLRITLAELVAPIYSFDVRQRIKVEPKDHIKARLRWSPAREIVERMVAEAEMIIRDHLPTLIA